MLVERLLPAARKRLVTIEDDAALIDAAKLLRGPQTDLVVVCGCDKLLAGVVTKSDVVRQISHCQGCSCTMAVSAVMTRAVTFCRPSDWLQDVWSIMKERGLKNVPIVDRESRPRGVLNARDALQVLLEEVEDEELLLRDYVMGIGYH
jgi:CBS domain-containing protein